MTPLTTIYIYYRNACWVNCRQQLHGTRKSGNWTRCRISPNTDFLSCPVIHRGCCRFVDSLSIECLVGLPAVLVTVIVLVYSVDSCTRSVFVWFTLLCLIYHVQQQTTHVHQYCCILFSQGIYLNRRRNTGYNVPFPAISYAQRTQGPWQIFLPNNNVKGCPSAMFSTTKNHL